MRVKWVRCYSVVLVIMSTLMVPPTVSAGIVEETPGPIRKLSRGLANSVTGILEIPTTIQSIGATEGPVAGIFLGLPMGVGTAVMRTAVGLAETVTFLFPLPKIGYEPLLKPEFLFRPES